MACHHDRTGGVSSSFYAFISSVTQHPGIVWSFQCIVIPMHVNLFGNVRHYATQERFIHVHLFHNIFVRSMMASSVLLHVTFPFFFPCLHYHDFLFALSFFDDSMFTHVFTIPQPYISGLVYTFFSAVIIVFYCCTSAAYIIPFIQSLASINLILLLSFSCSSPTIKVPVLHLLLTLPLPWLL
ncbi:hypothetical protein L228DRAFT_137830 [Xylona heveae TC161]|uniref:Uncharacterized protein n=1 Tax=Xylona heveae (strain CBS 132557 / TC161) TaxID=1328760 RepID=A0A165H0Y0_XYLHT|nr:hypothetical protein L228DRAFT_137830 [Xylona heveae TC161]KZF22848.1 hypothetical protein L228DRAFT_137830 [Xylona heveae TC161]